MIIYVRYSASVPGNSEHSVNVNYCYYFNKLSAENLSQGCATKSPPFKKTHKVSLMH